MPRKESLKKQRDMEDREEDSDESQYLEVQTSKEEVGEQEETRGGFYLDLQHSGRKETSISKTETVLSKKEDALDCKSNNQTDGQVAERMETEIIIKMIEIVVTLVVVLVLGIRTVVNWIMGLPQSIMGLPQSMQYRLAMAMSPLRPDDHHQSMYYVVVNKIMRNVMHSVFIMLFHPNRGATIRHSLFNRPGYSQRRYERQFTPEMRVTLDNEESDSFDVTLLYRLLQRVCGLANTSDNSWGTDGTLENSLKQMKDHRNYLAHNVEISFTFDDLKKKIKVIEKLCLFALESAGHKKGKKGEAVTEDIYKMEKEIDNVLSSRIDVRDLFKELKDLREKQTSILIREGTKDIERLSQKFRILEHKFTILKIEGKKDIEMQELLTTELSTGELPDIIIMCGPPGKGKTSFTRFLVHDWLSLEPTMLGLENIDLVLPVELHTVRSDNVKDLVKDEILHNVPKKLKNEDILSALKNVSLLWILDGYDKAIDETEKVINEILKKFINSRILITTRTEFKEKIEAESHRRHRCHMSVQLM